MRLTSISAAFVLLAVPVDAQTDPKQKGTIEDGSPKQEAVPNTTPDMPPSSGKMPDDNKTLSEQLKDGKGVIKPPPAVDPEIRQPTPAMPGNKMPVIVPPGEPDGHPTVQPK